MYTQICIYLMQLLQPICNLKIGDLRLEAAGHAYRKRYYHVTRPMPKPEL
uniref:Uncharacterized protein n=1 Tax=Rhizophora mucronata TaxID=61149 RepID=A0A2P2JNL3_RHIMU